SVNSPAISGSEYRGINFVGRGQSPLSPTPSRCSSRLRRRSGSSAAKPPAGHLWGAAPPTPPQRARGSSASPPFVELAGQVGVGDGEHLDDEEGGVHGAVDG